MTLPPSHRFTKQGTGKKMKTRVSHWHGLSSCAGTRWAPLLTGVPCLFRSVLIHFCSGLTVEGAKNLWTVEFNDRSIRKDQVPALHPDTGMPTGKLVWRIYTFQKTKFRDLSYQDQGARMALETKAKATDASILSVQQRFQAAYDAALCEGDVCLSSVVMQPATASSQTAVNHVSGAGQIMVGQGQGKRGKAAIAAGSGRGDARGQPPVESCGFPLIDKIAKSSKDPLTAASKVRKATMKSMNDMVIKLDRAKNICLNVLGKSHEDIGVPSLYDLRLRAQARAAVGRVSFSLI